MPRVRKEKVYRATQDAIKETAWRHIAEGDASALSLRAIARDMDITAPAIYRYFPDRDALVTALIVDAYTDFGDAQLTARDAIPPDDLVGQLLATGRAYRQWALAHPQRFRLIFGTPIPNYVAPRECVMPAASRALSALVSVVEALQAAGRLRPEAAVAVADVPAPEFEAWQHLAVPATAGSFFTAVLIWARVHGLVTLEVSHHLPPFGPSPDELYEHELKLIAQQFTK